MLTKMQQLKKQLVITLAVRVVILGVLLGGLMFLQSWRDDWLQQRDTLQAQVRALESQRSELQAQYQKAKDSLPLYESIMNKGDASGFDLDRERAKTVFDSLKFSHHLSTLNVSMSAIQAVERAEYRPKIAQMVASDLRLSCEGMSDEEILDVITTLREKLSGYVKVEEVSLKRNNSLTGEILVSLTRGELVPLTKGEMVIKWIGSKLPEANASSAPAAVKREE